MKFPRWPSRGKAVPLVLPGPKVPAPQLRLLEHFQTPSKVSTALPYGLAHSRPLEHREPWSRRHYYNTLPFLAITASWTVKSDLALIWGGHSTISTINAPHALLTANNFPDPHFESTSALFPA